MDKILATFLKSTSTDEVQQGKIRINQTEYEYLYDFDNASLILEREGKAKKYRMTYLVMEERCDLEARILARAILHHFKRELYYNG